MGKTRDLIKKIKGTEETFHAKMDTIKDRNGRDQTEAEDTKKRWQEYRSGLSFPSSGNLSNFGIKPKSPELQTVSFLFK